MPEEAGVGGDQLAGGVIDTDAGQQQAHRRGLQRHAEILLAGGDGDAVEVHVRSRRQVAVRHGRDEG
jgi:hypothetical protein